MFEAVPGVPPPGPTPTSAPATWGAANNGVRITTIPTLAIRKILRPMCVISRLQNLGLFSGAAPWAALLRRGDYVQAEVDVAEVNAVADDVYTPVERDGVSTGAEVRGVETVGLVGQGVRGGEVAEPGRVCRVSEAPDAGEAPGIADELRLTCRLAVGGGEVLVGSHQQRAVLVGDGRVRVTLAAGRVNGSPDHADVVGGGQVEDDRSVVPVGDVGGLAVGARGGAVRERRREAPATGRRLPGRCGAVEGCRKAEERCAERQAAVLAGTPVVGERRLVRVGDVDQLEVAARGRGK